MLGGSRSTWLCILPYGLNRLGIDAKGTIRARLAERDAASGNAL